MFLNTIIIVQLAINTIGIIYVIKKIFTLNRYTWIEFTRMGVQLDCMTVQLDCIIAKLKINENNVKKNN